MKMQKTLAELNAQVGDIVLFDGVKEYRVLEGKRIQSVGRDDSPDGVDYAPYWDKAKWFEMVSEKQPVLWNDMSDAEKGALLLAHHNGLAIEYYVDGWAVDNEFDPAEFSDIAYRVGEVKPKLEVEEIIWDDPNSFGKWRITFQIFEKRPVPASIKMEKFKYERIEQLVKERDATREAVLREAAENCKTCQCRDEILELIGEKT
jgi:hypothetical protein